MRCDAMPAAKPAQFITNARGDKTGVIISIAEYRRLLAALEDAEDSKLIAKTRREKETGLDAYKAKRRVARGRV